MSTLVTAEELSTIIKYSPRTILEQLKGRVLIEGKHFVRPFGSRKRVLFLLEAVMSELTRESTVARVVPMAGGRVSHG